MSKPIPRTVDDCLSKLAYSIAVGRQDARNGPRMLDAVFDNLVRRTKELREAIAKAKS